MENKTSSPNKSASRAGLLFFMLPIAVVCCHMTHAHSKSSGHTVASVSNIVSNEFLNHIGHRTQ